MDIFKPYIEIRDNGALLHLKLSSGERMITMLAARILPFLIIIVVFVSLYAKIILVSHLVFAAIVFLVITLIILLNAGTGTEVLIRDSEVEIYSLRLIGKRKVSHSIAEIDFIELEIFKEERIAGAFYRLVLKNGKRVLLLRITALDDNEMERIQLINERLSKFTNLKVLEVKFQLHRKTSE